MIQQAKFHQPIKTYEFIIINPTSRISKKFHENFTINLNLLNFSKVKYDYIKRYSRIFKQCCKIVGINNKHFHHIRHTYAVRRYLEVRDIYQIAKELDHSSVTTTEIYAKFNLSRLEQDFPCFTINNKKSVIEA